MKSFDIPIVKFHKFLACNLSNPSNAQKLSNEVKSHHHHYKLSIDIVIDCSARVKVVNIIRLMHREVNQSISDKILLY